MQHESWQFDDDDDDDDDNDDGDGPWRGAVRCRDGRL
jgi:hypothetical protein